MNILEQTKTDDQLLRVLFNSMTQVSQKIEKKQYWDVKIENEFDFYIALKEVEELLSSCSYTKRLFTNVVR